MATREQSGTNIEPGIIARVAAGVRYVLSGVGPDAWFGPQQPQAPQAQDQTEGRALDYPVGYNLRTRPREGENISFADLRGLADGYDLMRLIIETRKDQIESYEWEVVPTDKKTPAKALEGKIASCTAFLQRPDKEHNWSQWLRMVIEEILVIDALCVYPRKTRGDGMYGFELVDGATIKRLIDAGGRTPLPPEPAYQQVLKGISAADYSSDDLVYMMRNPRVSRFYGYSPVEQVITTVNIALRRQMSQLAFYTEGNVPEALAQVPEAWTVKQVKEFQDYWDSIMEGNQAQKRKMRFVPSLKDIVFPKDAVLKDEYDEWLARIVCFAFSISPTALIKQVNRASGEQMSDTAKEEGLMPLLRFLEAFVTYLLQKYLGMAELKFAWKIVNRVAPEQQAEIHEKYIKSEVLTPDEVRDDLGRDALTPEQREAAWPTPPEPGMDADGNPIPETPPAKKATEEPSAVEKMLADAIRMLDPQLLAGMLEKAAASQAPRIIEVKPEMIVEVGDTNVHVPAPSVHMPLAKREPDPREGQQLRSTRQADGSLVATWEPKS